MHILDANMRSRVTKTYNDRRACHGFKVSVAREERLLPAHIESIHNRIGQQNQINTYKHSLGSYTTSLKPRLDLVLNILQRPLTSCLLTSHHINLILRKSLSYNRRIVS